MEDGPTHYVKPIPPPKQDEYMYAFGFSKKACKYNIGLGNMGRYGDMDTTNGILPVGIIVLQHLDVLIKSILTKIVDVQVNQPRWVDPNSNLATTETNNTGMIDLGPGDQVQQNVAQPVQAPLPQVQPEINTNYVNEVMSRQIQQNLQISELSSIAPEYAGLSNSEAIYKSNLDIFVRRVYQKKVTVGYIIYVLTKDTPSKFDKSVQNAIKEAQSGAFDKYNKGKKRPPPISDKQMNIFEKSDSQQLNYYYAQYLLQGIYGEKDYKEKVMDLKRVNSASFRPSNVFTVENTHKLFNLPKLEDDNSSHAFYYWKDVAEFFKYDNIMKRKFPWSKENYPILEPDNALDEVYGIGKKKKIQPHRLPLNERDPIMNAQGKMKKLVDEMSHFKSKFNPSDQADMRKYLELKSNLYKSANGYLRTIIYDPQVSEISPLGVKFICDWFKKQKSLFDNRHKDVPLLDKSLSVHDNLRLFLATGFAEIFTLTPLQHILIFFIEALPINYMLRFHLKRLIILIGDAGNSKTYIIKVILLIMLQGASNESGGTSLMSDFVDMGSDRCIIKLDDEMKKFMTEDPKRLSGQEVNQQQFFKSKSTCLSLSRSIQVTEEINGEHIKVKRVYESNSSCNMVICGNNIPLHAPVLDRADVFFIPHANRKGFRIIDNQTRLDILSTLIDFKESKEKFLNYLRYEIMICGLYSFFADILQLEAPLIISTRLIHSMLCEYETFGIDPSLSRTRDRMLQIAFGSALYRTIQQLYLLPKSPLYHQNFKLEHLPIIHEQFVIFKSDCIYAFFGEAKDFVNREESEVLKYLKNNILHAANVNFENNVEFVKWIGDMGGYKEIQIRDKKKPWLDHIGDRSGEPELDPNTITLTFSNSHLTNIANDIHKASNRELSRVVIPMVLKKFYSRTVTMKRRLQPVTQARLSAFYNVLRDKKITEEVRNKNIEDLNKYMKIDEDVNANKFMKGFEMEQVSSTSGKKDAFVLKIARELFCQDSLSIPKEIVSRYVIKADYIKKFIVPMNDYNYSNTFENSSYSLLDFTNTQKESFVLSGVDISNHDERQKVIKAINFNDNRRLTRWITKTDEPINFDLDKEIVLIHAEELGLDPNNIITHEKAWGMC